MTSAKLLRFQGTVQSRGEASGHLKLPGDVVLIERGRPRWLLLSCPCGCGEEFPINLDPRAGPAWRLYMSQYNGISLYPSVWRESECESHYVIWRNKIFLFGRYEEDFDNTPQTDGIAQLTKAIRKRLPVTGLIPFSDIAEDLGEVPWDVLKVCRHLVRKGLVREGAGTQRDSFGRV